MIDLFITFDESLGFWSPAIYWFVMVNALATLVFTLVVIVGGCFDLAFLFRSLKEETVDETDDGRVTAPAGESPP